MQADDPPFLPVGTDVSAKYKGAFCEAKIKKVVRNIKCKVSYKGAGAGSATVTDEAIKGTLRVGNTVEVKHDQKKEMIEALITKIQDCSQYTVVFDDGDITTLRRSALCLKSGRHFAESETLDQLPLTHPEHFGNPVIGSSSRRGRRTNTRAQSDDSDSETCDTSGGSLGTGGRKEREPHAGRVVLVHCSAGDKKRAHHSHQWFPGLVVAPNAQDSVKIRVKDDYLVRSFKDGRYYTVPKKEAREFRRNNVNTEWSGVDAAILYLDKQVLPPHWDRDILFGQESQSQSDDDDSDDSSDDEPREEKDHFVAQLYKHMDDRGTPLNRQPTIANKDIDLYRLFKVVKKLGGYNRVTNQNQWKGIAEKLGFQPASNSVTNLCKQAYKKFLHSFEEFYRKLGVTLLAHPRGSRNSGRSLIRDRDKMHSTSSIQAASPAPVASSTVDEKSSDSTNKSSTEKRKEKETERENKEKEQKEKEIKEELEQKEKDLKLALKEKEAKELKEKEVKEKELKEKEARELKEAKEAKEKELKEKEMKEKEREKEKEMEKEARLKEIKLKEQKEQKEKELKEKDAKEKEAKEKEAKDKEKLKEKETKEKEKERERKEKEDKKDIKIKKEKDSKIKTESIVSSDEEDSGDNQPLVPISSKTEKSDTTSSDKADKSEKPDKPSEKIKSSETPAKSSKLFKSASATVDGKKSDKITSKKITHRRNSLPRSLAAKSDSTAPVKAEVRCKSSSSDSSTANKKQDNEKVKEKDSERSSSLSKKCTSSSDKNDSDSSSRGSKNGKTSSRRNPTPSETTPPSTPGASTAPHSAKRPRKRKITEPSEPGTTPKLKTADVGDKLKVYYGPTHSESKVTYEAKVIEIDGKGPETLLRVHYTGWNTRYDEWIKPSRIADNLSQHSKSKHKEKVQGRRANPPNAGTGPPESPGVKKARGLPPAPQAQPVPLPVPPATPPPASKPHTRNRSGSNNTIASNPPPTDISMQSDSDSECESDSSGQRPPDVLLEEGKPPKEKTSSESPEPPLDKVSDTDKEKAIKTPRIGRSPQVKRSGEGSLIRVKRTRLKQDDSDTPRGRDFDLNEIRSELKGLEKTVKPPTVDTIKEDPEGSPTKEVADTGIVIKQEKTPEKVTEDIYEFKEPEPFEFEARKSEEKKKRLPTHRIFDDLPQLKLSPTTSPDKSPVAEVEKSTPKSHFDVAFDKLCQSEDYQVDSSTTPTSTSTSVEKEPLSSLFGEMVGEDSGDRLQMSETEDSQEPLFTYQQELFPDKPFLPIFKGFKNQETYSKKDANKMRDIEDDFTNSPQKGDQSSDEDPIDAAIQRVNAHSMSDDSNDGDLLIKTPATPTVPQGGLLATFATTPSDCKSDILTKDDTNETENDESLPESKSDNTSKSKTETQSIEADKPETPPETSTKVKDIEVQEIQSEATISSIKEDSESNLEPKSESESTAAFVDVVIPEPPVGFLIHKEGPSIAEKVLRAISSAKRAATPSPKSPKREIVKNPRLASPKTAAIKASLTLPIIPDSIKIPSSIPEAVPPQTAASAEIPPQPSQKPDLLKSVKVETVKKDTSTPSVEVFSRIELIPSKTENLPLPKKETVERRKSIAEPSLGGKSNKVLSETIQKLSSQISQPTLPLAEYTPDDRSDTSDSDDSDRRLIIDKLSEEESQSGISLSETNSSHPSKVGIDKSTPHWSTADSQQDTENEKSSTVPESSTKDLITKQPEEDSNISLLLCEETIPGSPAPENLSEGTKSSSKPRSTRNLEIPFASAPSISPDPASKDPLSLKDIPRESSRERREVNAALRNEQSCNDAVDTVMDNTPPITPDSSLDNMSPSRDQQLSDGENISDMKMIEDDNRTLSGSSKKMIDMEKSSSGGNLRGPPDSPGGPRRGRRPRSCRLSESEDQNTAPPLSYANTHRPLKYNFYVDLADPCLDGAARITLLTSRLADLRKAYHNVKAELATIDRRRKKLRRKEREAVKAAKAACS